MQSVRQGDGSTPRRWTRWSRGLRRGGALALAILGLVLIGGWGLRWVPLPPGLKQRPAGSWEFVDRHGLALRAVPEAQGYRRWSSLDSLPSSLVAATLAAEDKRFWRHPGVDGLAVARALAHRLRYGRIVSGGSTVTQQLVKLADPQPRTWRHKLIEGLQALRLEQVWPKERILEEYLNRLDYGNQCFGCAEAAAFYFGKPPTDLSVAEAALLAGLPQAPSRLNPVRHPERARKRQQWILDRMRHTEALGSDAWARARSEPLRFVAPQRRFEAPHFIDLILLSAMGPGGIPGPDAAGDGGVVRTTLDLELQRLAERVLRRHLRPLRERSVRHGAVVVIENATGDVLALVGSPDFFAIPAGQVNGAWARRSPGSALKPFTVLLALERDATPASVVADLPTDFPTATGVFRPVNYDRRHRGPIRVREALANSLNIPAVKLLDHVGGPAVLQDRLKAWGLTTLEESPEHYGLGLTLGNAEVRLLELTAAYATLARLGQHQPYRLLRGPGAQPPELPQPAGPDPRPAWLVADILSDNGARALAFGAESDLRFEFPVACKTGTSSGFRDNWAFGFTPEYTMGVWVGNADGSPMDHVSGVTGAAPVLQEIFVFLHERWGTAWYVTPPGIAERRIHPVTGHQVAASDPRGVRERFLAERLPPEESPADYDLQGRVRLPALYRAWLESAENRLGTGAVADPGPVVSEIRIRVPMAGAVYYLDSDLPAASQWLGLDAEGPPGLVWESPTLTLRVEAGRPQARLEEGRHGLRVRSPGGQAHAETWIQVNRR